MGVDIISSFLSSANFYIIPGAPDPLLCGNSSDAGWVLSFIHNQLSLMLPKGGSIFGIIPCHFLCWFWCYFTRFQISLSNSEPIVDAVEGTFSLSGYQWLPVASFPSESNLRDHQRRVAGGSKMRISHVLLVFYHNLQFWRCFYPRLLL